MHESYTGRTMQKMLVAFGNRMDPSQVEIRAISTKDAKGTVQEMPPPRDLDDAVDVTAGPSRR